MADNLESGEQQLAHAIAQLVAVSAVVRFESDGFLRLAAVDPTDADERLVVRLRPADGDWASAVVAGAQLLTNDLRAVAARVPLRVVR